jgi:hypothetical protein
MSETDREARVTFCTMELYNLWYAFSRALFLSSAFGARDGSGKPIALSVSPAPKSVDDALTHAIRRLRPQNRRNPPWSWWDEPNWSKTRVLLDALDAIGSANRAQVSAGLSTQTAVFDYLFLVRHFYAHRGRETRQALHALAVSYSLPPALHPSQALLLPARLNGTIRPQPVLLDWIDDVRNSISLVV